MKKGKLIHSEISYEISKMGHTDAITICDSGLPIPNEVKRIDLALQKGIPSFIQTFQVVLEELRIEEIIIAQQIKEVSGELYEEIINIIKERETKESITIKIQEIDHEQFKRETKKSKCIIRTGEYTPYANIILKSGVVF